jgi:GntR family transcriptional regulator, transcriptional repressor for pyruvate dehydrogenase complex
MADDDQRTIPPASMFTPVPNGRMSADIVDQVIDLIRARRLQPGDRLPPERQLTELFEVSRVTVRDALRVLEVLGLIEIRVGSSGGAFVTVPSPPAVGRSLNSLLMMRTFQARELAEARLVIELGVLALALGNITDDEIESLRLLCDESQSLLDKGEYNTELSIAFHSQIARATKNAAVLLLSESFAGPLSLAAVREQEAKESRQRRTVEEHKALVEALAARDAAGAREILISHVFRGLEPDEGAAFLLAPTEDPL